MAIVVIRVIVNDENGNEYSLGLATEDLGLTPDDPKLKQALAALFRTAVHQLWPERFRVDVSSREWDSLYRMSSHTNEPRHS